jgi:hypothetical protein
LAAARVVVAAAAVAPLGDASASGEFFGFGELAVAVGVEAPQESGGDTSAGGVAADLAGSGLAGAGLVRATVGDALALVVARRVLALLGLGALVVGAVDRRATLALGGLCVVLGHRRGGEEESDEEGCVLHD